MNVKYLDPYKDDKYGKIRGDKSGSYFKVSFKEAKLYRTDDAIILAGEVTKYDGLVRGYKPELALEPGLCAIPFYRKEYEIRRKDGEKWVLDKIQPSIFEKAIYDWLDIFEKTPDYAVPGCVSGDITHIPNGMVANADEQMMTNYLNSNIDLRGAIATGNLPAYEPPKDYAPGGGGKKSYGLSPVEKLMFIKNQLAIDTKDSEYTPDRPMLELINQMLVENPMDGEATQLYFDCLLGCVK
jgi:hypothetical protein